MFATLFHNVRHGRARAQSLVELALVLGVVLLILFGLLDAIQIVMIKTTLQHAVEAGANQAALIGGEDTTPNGRVTDITKLVLDSGVLTRDGASAITVTCAAPCRRYSAITVAVRYTDRVFVPIGPFGSFALTASATRASEQDVVVAGVATPTSVATSTPTAAPTATPTATPVPINITASSSGPSNASPRTPVAYTFSVNNTTTGQTANNVVLTLTLPAGVTLVNAGGATVSGQTLTWMVGALPANTTRSYVVQVSKASAGVVRLFADATTTSPETTTLDNDTYVTTRFI